MPKRLTLKIAGESGMGIDSSGMIVMKALKNSGFWIFGEREFPSLIKGGRANVQINISTSKVRSLSSKIDIGLAFDREGLRDCLETVREGGLIIHGFERWNKVIKDLPTIRDQKKLEIIEIPAREIALEKGGSFVMVNVLLLGFLWKVLDLPISSLEQQIEHQFASKPQFLDINRAVVRGGYAFEPETPLNHEFKLDSVKPNPSLSNPMIMDGNSALVLGAVKAGVRTYFGYPMSPSSSILTYMADLADKYNILVKQVEDEITAVQMTLGSMHMGARSLTATSGGGFDLMTETVSLSAMIEVPLVIIIAQRPGPATGLPTWTAQADLNLAIHAGHGEFTKCVMAVSDPKSCFETIQKAFNIAETYQIPVIVLTEATTGMSFSTILEADLKNTTTVKRGLVNADELENLKSSDRFLPTENGVSKRWLPGTAKASYFANGDEHWNSGEITEEAETAKQMVQKRNLKTKPLLAELEPPLIYGQSENAEFSFVGWGSTKRTILDVLDILEEKGISANYLHYENLWPLNVDRFVNFYQNNSKIILVEGNYEGQLGKILEEKSGLKFTKKILKWDGRPFYVEDILEETY